MCHDYVIVDVDARGAFKSEGDIQIFGEVDAGDGYDVIEWAARQAWSNGAVGMHGASWLAMAQWNIAATNPPHLKAINPWNGQSDLIEHGTFFSMMVIYLMNFIVLSFMLILASRYVTFDSFSKELLAGAMDFSDWVLRLVRAK